MKEDMSYASALSVNISVSSSIPDSESGVFIALYPYFNTQIFKGNTHTEISILYVPSVISIQVFVSESSEWSDETGYHFTDTEETSLGSLATQDT